MDTHKWIRDAALAALMVIVAASGLLMILARLYVELALVLIAGIILALGIKYMFKKHGFMSNPVTGSIVASIVALFTLAGIMAWEGSPYGIVFAVMAMFIIAQGLVKGSDNPFKLRIVKIWDNPVTIGGRCAAVAGTMIEANYPPFYVSTTQIDMTRKSLDYVVDVLSKDADGDKVPAKVKVTVVGVPDEDDLFSFDKSGQWDGDGKGDNGIKQDLKLTINKETENICCQLDIEDMVARSAVITEDQPGYVGLQTRLVRWLEEQKRDRVNPRSFGFRVILVTADVEIPEELRKKMIAAKGAKYETSQRKTSQGGMADIAEDLLRRARAAGDDELTMAQAMDHVIRTSLLEKDELSRVQIETLGDHGGGSLNVNDVHIHVGKNKGQRQNDN